MAIREQSAAFRQNMLVVQSTGAATINVSAGDQYKVFASVLSGTATYKLPKANPGTGPFYWSQGGSANTVVIAPAGTDDIGSNGGGNSVTLPTLGSGNTIFYGLFCVQAGVWTPINLGTGGLLSAPVNITAQNIASQTVLTLNMSGTAANQVGLSIVNHSGGGPTAWIQLVNQNAGGRTYLLDAQQSGVANAGFELWDQTANKAIFQVSTSGTTWLAPSVIPTGNNGTISVNGFAGNYTLSLFGSSTSGNSFGLNIQAGTTSADTSVKVSNQGNTINYFSIRGDGLVFAQTTSQANTWLNLANNGTAGSMIWNLGTNYFSTGAVAAALTANKPGSLTTILGWVKCELNGTVGWIPVWNN